MAMVFMGVSSLAFAVAFHAMRGMYLHAEGLHKRSAEDCGKPLRRARAAPSAKFGFLICARQSA
jgi:hypothetical protein